MIRAVPTKTGSNCDGDDAPYHPVPRHTPRRAVPCCVTVKC
jgi:hypothetical protein